MNTKVSKPAFYVKKVLLLSDTHGYFGPEIARHAEDADEVWHAGDIGNQAVVTALQALKPLRAVYGNIDGQEIRTAFPLHNRFTLEGIDIWITHIGGYPGRYNPKIRQQLLVHPPDLFVTGHSHILRVEFDSTHKFLYLNPGAIGKQGFHKLRTMIEFEIQDQRPRAMRVIELKR